MACLICGHSYRPFLTKVFTGYDLGRAHYSRCTYCGFVLSDTHAEMSEAQWQELNHSFHSSYQGQDNCPEDPNWIERLRAQVEAIAAADSVGLLPGPWLDYACGDGKLADYLEGRVVERLQKYDAFMAQPGYLKEEDLQPRRFKFVITTSVFEHLRERDSFERIQGLVADDGVMGLHTLVCENVPQDPDWFYYLPVHCAFHTNRSMSILLDQWGYQSSIYNLESRLWFLFKVPCESIAPAFAYLKEGCAATKVGSWFYKTGFMDYWK